MTLVWIWVLGMFLTYLGFIWFYWKDPELFDKDEDIIMTVATVICWPIAIPLIIIVFLLCIPFNLIDKHRK